MANAKLSPKGKEYIVYLRRQGLIHDDILEKLNEVGEEISKGRISTIWKKYKHSKTYGKKNPFDQGDDYEETVEEDNDYDETVEKVDNMNVVQKDTTEPEISFKPTLGFTSGDIEPYLRSAGISKRQIKQISDIFSYTDGSARELAKILEMCELPPLKVKQIVTHVSKDPDIFEKIYKGTDQVTGNGTQKNNPLHELDVMYQQQINAKSRELEYDQIESALSKLKKKPDSDTIKEMKELIMLRTLADTSKPKDSPLYEKLLAEKLTNKSDSVENAMKLINEMNKMVKDNVSNINTGNSTNDVLLKLLVELSTKKESNVIDSIEALAKVQDMFGKKDNYYEESLREENAKLRDLDSQNQKNIIDIVLKQNDERISSVTENFKNMVSQNDKLNEAIRESNKKFYEMQLKQAENQSMGFDDFVDQIGRSVELAKKMGLVEKGTGAEFDASAKRMETLKDIVQITSDKVESFVDKMMGGVMKYIDHVDKKDSRNMEARLLAERMHRQNGNNGNNGNDDNDVLPQVKPKKLSRDERLDKITGNINVTKQSKQWKENLDKLNTQEYDSY